MPVERFCAEVNARVNDPIENALVQIDNTEVFDVGHELDRYCVSYVSCKVARFGLTRVVNSWNEHPTAVIYRKFEICFILIAIDQFS